MIQKYSPPLEPMPANVILTGILVVVLVVLLVFMLEFFIPLSAKWDMNVSCRSTLLKMELDGGLSQPEKDALQEKLSARGFTNITISNTAGAKQGQELNLRVEADYPYSRLTNLFARRLETKHMVYDKTAIARKVVN